MLKSAPYLSVIYKRKFQKTELCLILNMTKKYVSYYSINELKYDDYLPFFQYCIQWWNNCKDIPISIYHYDSFKKFKYCKHFLLKSDCEVVDGYQGTQLKELTDKRIKRKIITVD